MHLGKQFSSNKFNSNTIDKSNHISNRKSLGFGDDEFDFDDALKSVNISCLEFTNYFDNSKDPMLKFTKKEYKRLLYGKVNLDEEYEMKLVNVEYLFNELKIKKIYSDTLGKEIKKLPLIYKLRNEQNKELQFYVTALNKKFKVCFIDIYHLAIPTKVQNTKAIYESHCHKNYCLSNLKN